MPIDADQGQGAQPVIGAVPAGRYQGTLKRESDGATFLEAVQLGAATDTKQFVQVFSQLGGGLPSTPQFSGDATALGPILFFQETDNVATRKYIFVVFGNLMIEISTATYPDGRPDLKLTGVLKK
jgi:hypothetical protein